MNKIEPKNVGKDVEKSKKKKPTVYKKGPFPFTIIHRETKVLYVRKTITLNRVIKNPRTGVEKFVRQRQVWKTCHTGTKEEVDRIIKQIELEFNLAKRGRTRPLVQFKDIAEKFETVELTEAQFRNEKKVSGKIQLRIPRLIVKKLIEHFGRFSISNITYGDLQEYKQIRLQTQVEKDVKITTFIPREKRPAGSRKRIKTEKLVRRTPRSIRSVNYELTILKQIFNFAVRNRWLDRNPFADGKNLIDTKQENRRYKTWTREEEKRALTLSTGLAAHMKPVIICVVDGGFRKDELLSARWSDVNFETGEMLAKNYKGDALRVRSVYMTRRMKAALEEWKRLQPEHKNADPSFVIGYKDVKRAWNTIRKSIGREDLRLHDLRHVFATRLSQNNVPIDNISKLLGHSQISTTQIYLNPSAADLRSSIQKLEEDE